MGGGYCRGKVLSSEIRIMAMISFPFHEQLFHHRIAVLCSRAEFIKTKEDWDKVDILKWPVKGDTTETGLIKCYELL